MYLSSIHGFSTGIIKTIKDYFFIFEIGLHIEQKIIVKSKCNPRYRSGMLIKRLKLNRDKDEMMFIGTHTQCMKHSNPPIQHCSGQCH